VIYSYNVAKMTESVVYTFQGGTEDGAKPRGELLTVNGVLWGTTTVGRANGTGTIFQFNPATGVETVSYSFDAAVGTDGATPSAALINLGGIFYGTTFGGGPFGAGQSGKGTVFSFNPATGVETPIYAFGVNAGDGSQPAAPVLAVNGLLYGTTLSNSNAFVVNPANGTEQVLYSFTANFDYQSQPAGLVHSDGTLHGVSDGGGSNLNAYGFVYGINVATGTYSTVYEFLYGKDGASPSTGLLAIGGNLYGTTDFGGSRSCHQASHETYGCGTVFSVNPPTGTETQLAVFGKAQDAPSVYEDGNTRERSGRDRCRWSMSSNCPAGLIFVVRQSLPVGLPRTKERRRSGIDIAIGP
jgi:uncharacterized repeat protein (TIGR03803 family)